MSTRRARQIPTAPRSSDPDEPAIPGLQVYGIESDAVESRGVYIPQSPASSDIPGLLYSNPAFRSRWKQISPQQA
jgi:hypothetical protein